MPKTTVAALIITVINSIEHVLLTRRALLPFQHHWCLPGGHIEPYEQAQDAVIREVQEETGLAFDARFFAYFDEIIPAQDIHAVVLVFIGQGTGTMTAQPGEVSAIEWFSLAAAQALPLAFQHNMILDAYVNRAPAS